MHGIIFSELQKYVDAKLGANAWSKLLTQAGLGGKMYMPIQEYPDAEAVALVTTASKITGLPAGKILEDFGEFITPDLLKMYGSLLDPKWKTLDVIERTEATIHKVVRMKNPGAKPPELVVTRTKPDELLLTYSSARKMCGVAKGIARGLARHFNEKVAISEAACMSSGAPSCKITIRKA